MPLQTPAGPLKTLDEVVIEARLGLQGVQARYLGPVLLVVAPQEPWAERTQARQTLETRSPSVQMFPTLVVAVDLRDDGDLTFGRGKDCAVVLPFAAISKEHGFLRSTADGWTLSDFGSKNGSFVDGARVLPGALAALRDGATVRFGDVTARFRMPHSFLAELRRRAPPG